MSRLTDGAEALKCSFCGKSQKQVRKLIGGSGVYICNECVDLCNEIIAEDVETSAPAADTPLPKPREIFDFLDSWVIGQERAKRALSVAVYNHYKRVRSRESGNEEDMYGTKSNILLLGPTGTGKTHLARSLARLLDVPFAIVDATALTEAGYVGEDVENILLRLIQEAGGDIQKAERGIIYVDEIDKIGRKGENASITRAVPPQGGRKHPHQQFLEIDTSGILFIAAGAFAGIEEIVKARLGQRSTGFGTELKSASEMGDLYESITPEDLHKFGMIPEFIGRLPILTSTKELSEQDLTRVLTEPRNCLVRQYQHLFELDGIALEFTHEALLAIAEQANARKTGARGLSSIMENTLSDLMFDLPSRSDVARVVVTKEAVEGTGNAELYEVVPPAQSA